MDGMVGGLVSLILTAHVARWNGIEILEDVEMLSR